MKLTLPQLDIYREQLIFPGEPIYNIGARISIEGHLDKNAFEQSYVKLIERHDVLRSYLKGTSDTIEFEIAGEVRPLEFIDWSDRRENTTAAIAFMQQEFKIAFDLEKDKFLYRFILIRITDDFHFLFSVYHHILTDGWGTSLMFERLVNDYNELLSQGEIRAMHPYPYQDFIDDEERYLTSREFEDDRKFWVGKFSPLPESIFFKLDPTYHINKSARKEVFISRDTYNKLIALSTDNKSSTFHIILAILYAYLAKRYQQEHLSVGLPVLNRSSAKFKKTVGLFMGINPLLIAVDVNESFVALVARIRNQLRQDYRHQRLPIGQLVRELGVFLEKERLFNITLSYEKQDYSACFLNTITKVIPLSHEAERVALAIYIREFSETEDVKIDFDYNVNYLTEDEIGRLTAHFRILLEEVLLFPQKPIKDLNFLSDDEKYFLLSTLNDTDVNYPQDKTVVDLFEAQVMKTPDKLAVRDARQALSYYELNKQSDAIAAHLTTNHREEKAIAVLVDRSAGLLAVLLGILKAGKCYIPIDPMLPAERIAYIVRDSQTSLIIISDVYLKEAEMLQSFFREKENNVTFIAEEYLLHIQPYKMKVTYTKPARTDTAYVIYTSGSTGNPKGVEIGHQGLTNFLLSMKGQPGVNADDTLYAVTTYSFDISILEFFAPLIAGACVFVADRATMSHIAQLIGELAVVKPTIIQATPSFFQMLCDAGWKPDGELKVLCGGDRLSQSLAGKLLATAKEVWNMYGPTETTIWSTIQKLAHATQAAIIGRPINNTQIYIVNKTLSLLPVGTVGSIYIAGDGLAKGYYKNGILTQERFIGQPFGKTEKMYYTGDIGRWLPDGSIEFLGREDHQVKIRGYRIELGEVENHLYGYSEMIDQVVVDAREMNGEKVLVAYYSSTQDTSIDKVALREYMESKLPGYMVPGFYVELAYMPLTPNGKIDRKALPEVSATDLIRTSHVTPGNETEQRLVEIWKEALGLETVGITDNFFDLGGHSLIAGRIVHAISRQLKVNISLKHIFQYTTIEKLAAVLPGIPVQEGHIPPAQQKEYYQITTDQHNIWVASQKTEQSDAHNMYAVCRVTGSIDVARLSRCITTLIIDNAVLRTNFIERGGKAYQVIRDPEDFTTEVIKNIAPDDLDTFLKNYVTKTFDLENDLLLKIVLVRSKIREEYLIFLTHHIIVDGMSLEIMLDELINLYHGQKKSDTATVQFNDYTEWIHQIADEHKNSFHELDLMQIAETRLLSDVDNTVVKSIARQKTFILPEEHYKSLKELSSKSKVTNYTIMLTAIGTVLSKLYEQDNICIGTVFSGRNHPQVERAIGMFIKMLPFQLSIQGKESFKSLLLASRQSILRLEDLSNLSFTGNIRSLTDFLVVYQHADALVGSVADFGTFTLDILPVYLTTARFPLVFNFFETDNLKCEMVYDMSVDVPVLELIWENLEMLLASVYENPDKSIEELTLHVSGSIAPENARDISFDF